MRTNQPFVAARIESSLNRRVESVLRRLRWHDAIVAHTGYGSSQRLRVLGRVILLPPGKNNTALESAREQAWSERRGWRNFITQPAVRRFVNITVAGKVISATTDRSGYIDITVSDHGLSPGWHHVTVETRDSGPASLPVLIVADDIRFGIISDIDDTVITTYLPRIFIAAYNSFVVTESARIPVAGMARMYRDLLRDHPGSPLIYLSTGAWNTQPFLERFIGHHGFPPGPMLLTDWGPTNNGWFRSGPEHKIRSLHRLILDFPHIRWLLVGDDGQLDPRLYAEFAAAHPDHVAGIAIRELNPVEQVLAHGTFTGRTSAIGPRRLKRTVPETRGHDGSILAPHVKTMLRGAVADPNPA
ncbi:MAG: DUF2183 domain-containing protein [Propionibacteriaceae bacterium]|jgi:phosphatidate phosphatase APP1|nr:DUF2183 domain-containing protein [Propionibacteriaceae bacterium]